MVLSWAVGVFRSGRPIIHRSLTQVVLFATQVRITAGIFRRSLRSKALTVSERKSRQVSPWEHRNLAGVFPFFLTLTIS